MENCSTPPFDQKNYEETTTLFGIDEEGSVVKRRRKRRSLGRRVSFAEAPAYHIYARDDEYISPSHGRQDAQGSLVQKVPERRSPRLASKRQAVDSDDKENWRPAVPNLSDDHVRRRSKKPLSNVEQIIFSPTSRPTSWHPARNTSSLAGDDGEISGFVDTRNTSFQQKEHLFDEDVTLDSTTFTFKLSQLHNLNSQPVGQQDMLIEPPPSIKRNKGLSARRESPACGSGENDMSMSFTMVKPIIRPKIVDLHPGHVDGNTDMSITMQVPCKHNSFLGIHATKQAEVIELLKATLSTENGEGSALDAQLADTNSQKKLKILHDTQEKLRIADEEIAVSEAGPRIDLIENAVTRGAYGELQKESVALAGIPENGGRGKRLSITAVSVKDTGIMKAEHPEGLTGILHVCHGYEGELPGSPTSNRKTEATEIKDVGVSPISASVLAFEGYIGSARELDHSKSSSISSLRKLVQQEESAQKLLAKLPEEKSASVADNKENVLKTRSVGDHLKQNTVFAEGEDTNLVLKAMLGKDLSEGRDIASTIAETTDCEGKKHNVSATTFSQEPEKLSPGLTASYQKEDSPLTMDMSVSPTSTATLADGGWKQPVRELDRSITMDIPSLQDLVQEEEDEDMVTDMKMDTEIVVSITRVSESVVNSSTKASRSFQGSDGKPFEGERTALVEKDFLRATCIEEKSSYFYRGELEQDRSITMGIPCLEDIIKEEEEDDTVLEGQKTAAKNVLFPSSRCGIRNAPSSDGDFGRSITAQVPRCSDLLAADSAVSPDIAWNSRRRSSWVAPPPSCLASTQLGESEACGNFCATQLSDSGMEIVDDCGEPTLYSKDIASIQDTQKDEVMNSSSAEIVHAVENADFQVVDLTRHRSSPNLQNETPTGGSGESMDIVGVNHSILHSSSVRLAKTSHQDDIRTPTDCSGQMVIVEDTTHRHMPSDNIHILKKLLDRQNKSSQGSGESMDIVPEATNAILHLGSSKLCKLSRSFENRTATDGSEGSTMIVEERSQPKSFPVPVTSQISARVGNFSPSANFKPDQDLSLYLSPVRHSQNEARVRDYKSYTPSPTPRTFDAKELINSVLKSAARLATTTEVSLHQRIANMKSRNELRKSRFTDGAESRSPQPLANFTIVPAQPFSPGSKFQMSPHKERHADRAENVETPVWKDPTEHSKKFTGILSPNLLTKNETSLTQHYHLPPLSTMTAEDENLSLTGQTTEIQQDSLSILRERVALQLYSGRKVQLASGCPTKDDTQATRYKEVEQASSLTDESHVQHTRNEEGNNVSVEEFLKLAEVQFSSKPGKSSPFVTDCSLLRACEVSNIDDAFKLSFLVKPQVMHLVEACNLVQDELQRLRTSEARLEEVISASNPPLFSHFQKVGTADKQRLKEQIDRLQTKCRLVEEGKWLNFRLGLEDDWSVKLLESKMEIQSYEQELREGKRFLQENYKQILNLQVRILSKSNQGEEYLSDKAPTKADEEKARNKCALDKIKDLKGQMVDGSLSRKVKLEKLLKRTQTTEEAWSRSKVRLESSQCLVHDLQTKLVENVRMGHSQAGGLQIAASPDFYVKEMVNKVSLLKAFQGGWQVRAVGHDTVELTYSPIIRRRLVIAESLNATSVTKSTWDLDPEKIELMFPGINAAEAFQQIRTDGADYVFRKLRSLRACIQGTRFLVNNFLMLMEEVGRCQKVPNAVAGRGVLVIARFKMENDEHMYLDITFLDCLLSAKFILTLDLRCAQLNGYPFGAMPAKVDMKYCPPRVSHKLTKAAIEAALATVEPGYHRVERLCATVGSLLASVKK